MSQQEVPMRGVTGSVLTLGVLALGLLLLCPAGSAQAQERAARGACKADVEKLCKDVKPGEGRIAQCLKSNEANVSAGCKEAMAQMHDKMQAFMDACGEDAKQYCGGVQRGHGRIWRCLKENDAKLSEGCRTAMQGAKGGDAQK
jgi:cysteine rich repeat protein